MSSRLLFGNFQYKNNMDMDSDPNSIKSGFPSTPQWIRSKTDRSDDAQFSPPSHDDSFFYIRYPVESKPEPIIKVQISNEVLSANSSVGLKNLGQYGSKNLEKHTEQCRKFFHESSVDGVSGVKHPPKSFGTDDGFKGPGAACGSSIVKVAQQMVSSGRTGFSGRGFKVANLENEDIDESCQLKTVEDQTLQTSSLIKPEPYEAEAQKYNRIRRGSKSLPASPLGSPKSMRKYHNPYFTNTIFSNTNTSEGKGWFLTSLLGIQREATPYSSSQRIEEEPETKFNNNNNSDSSSNLQQKLLKAKPSELREMNFWSPTSL